MTIQLVLVSLFIFTTVSQEDFCTFESAEDLCSCWNNSQDDELDWRRQVGHTPSLFTGPTDGSYLYMEASYVPKGWRARLESSLFPAHADGKLTFWYHMHEVGSHGCMGTLAVYFVSDTNKTDWWLAPGTDLVSGNQGGKWKRMEVKLSSEKTFMVRIEAVRGKCYRSDIAIDNITYPSYCGQTDVDECQLKTHDCDKHARCTNTGGSFLCSCSKGYQGNGTTCTVQVIAVDGSWSVWSSWSMCSVTCGQIGRRISTRTCDNPVPENGGNPCSVDGSADTKLEDCNVTGNPCFLFACDFDHTCNYGELPSSDVEDCFFNVVDNLEDNQNWHMREGPTLTWGTGPSADHTTGVGSYAYFEASHSADNYKRPGQNALLVSPTIGPVLADRHPCIEFYYHMYSMDTDLSAMGKLNVLLKTYERSSEGRLWKLEETVWTRSGNQGSEWLLGAVQVPINVPFQVIFEAVRGESTSGQSDIAIDDIKVGVNCSGLPLNHCSHPGIPRNAETYNSPHGLVLPAGSQIHFRCVAGYFVSSGGSLVRTCVNGHWTGTQITCYRANCRGLTEGEQVLDACERLCHCVHNQLTDCHRIRKEITVMPLSERERYVKTLKNLSRTQAYQDLIGIHSLIYEEGIHNKLYFLPWHRYYLLALENHLRQLDCRVTVPYWDWSAVASNPFQSPLWRGDSYHFGSAEGHREDNYCIRNGPFEKGQWFWVDRDRGYLPSNWYCLKRQADLAATFYNKIQVADVLQKARVYNSKHDLEFRFTQFEEELRINMHMGVHCAILGDMCTYEAANAPEFFLHHGMVDLIWLRYQSLSSAHQTVYYMDNTAPMTSSDGRSLTGPFNVSVTDFLFITDLPRMGSSEPGPLSVKYQAMYPILDEALHSLNLTELEAVCSGPPSYLRDSTWLAFSVSQEERAAAMELMERMQKTTNGTCELEEVLKHHIHDQLGFDVGKVVNLLHHHGRIGRRSVNSLRQRYVLGRNSKE